MYVQVYFDTACKSKETTRVSNTYYTNHRGINNNYHDIAMYPRNVVLTQSYLMAESSVFFLLSHAKILFLVSIYF